MQDGTRSKSRSGTETRKRSTPVTTRYDDEELAQLDLAASNSGLTRASFQRVQSLATPKTKSKKRAPVDRELLARALGQCGKIGSNLNQIAHAANLNETQADELDDALKSLRLMLPLLMKALGRDL